MNGNHARKRQAGCLYNGCWERNGRAWQEQGDRIFVGAGCYEAVVECQVSTMFLTEDYAYRVLSWEQCIQEKQRQQSME